jgi:hypothetical protein
MLAFADVIHFLAHELAGLRAGGFALLRVSPRPLHGLLLRHGCLLPKSLQLLLLAEG